MTDDLIARLVDDLRPARGSAVARRLALALGVGGVASLCGVGALLGLRPDLRWALATPMFWVKLAYTGAFAAVGALCVVRLARPAGRTGGRLAWLAAPLALIILTGAVQIAGARADQLRHLFMGDSAAICPWYIALSSAPALAGLFWALRGLAPTRLRLAGALAGLAAGGLGAAIYCLHCPEAGAPFVALWYSLGMLAPCVIGLLAGPRLLRW